MHHAAGAPKPAYLNFVVPRGTPIVEARQCFVLAHAAPDRRDRMAAAAAPYIHPRLSSTQIGATIKRDITELTRDELVAIIANGRKSCC